MAPIRIVEGVDPEDRVAFGLPAPRLLVAAAGLVLAIGCWSSGLPVGLRGALTTVVAAVTAVLAWGQVGGRPVVQWAPLVAGYGLHRWRGRRRSGPPVRSRGDGDRETGAPAHLRVVAAGARVAGAEHPPPFPGGTRRIVFFSLKGGVGRTTLAIEVAAVLASTRRVRTASARSVPLQVAVVDLDVDAGGVAERLGLTGPSLADLLAPGPLAPERVRRALVVHPDSGLLALLAPGARPTCSGDQLGARAADVLHALDGAGVHAAVVDLGPGLTPLARSVLETAHDIVVLVTPTPTVVADASRVAGVLEPLALPGRVHLVCNRVGSGERVEAAARALGAPLAASIPFDPRFDHAEWSHVPTVLASGGRAPDGLVALAAALLPSVQGAGDRESAASRAG